MRPLIVLPAARRDLIAQAGYFDAQGGAVLELNEETVSAAFLTQRFREEPNENPAAPIGGGLPE